MCDWAVKYGKFNVTCCVAAWLGKFRSWKTLRDDDGNAIFHLKCQAEKRFFNSAIKTITGMRIEANFFESHLAWVFYYDILITMEKTINFYIKIFEKNIETKARKEKCSRGLSFLKVLWRLKSRLKSSFCQEEEQETMKISRIQPWIEHHLHASK